MKVLETTTATIEFEIAENGGRDTDPRLAHAVGQNDTLRRALHEARNEIMALRAEVDKLSAPPSTYGVYLSAHDDDTVDILAQGRKARVGLHPTIKVDRPDRAAAGDIFQKYLTHDLPIAAADTRRHGGVDAAVDAMIASALDAMFERGETTQFLEVSYANGEKEVLHFGDFVSGAMIESVVRRAKKLALKRCIGGGEKGLVTDDLVAAVREEFKENEDLPNTSNPDDWAKIAGRKGERIAAVKSLVGHTRQPQRNVEKVIATGQYL